VHFGKAEINQRIDIAICDCINAAAFSAIAAIRPTKRPEFFTTKGCDAVAAITGNDFDFCFVDKLHNICRYKTKKALPGAEPFD
jgi:hypothetical protein